MADITNYPKSYGIKHHYFTHRFSRRSEIEAENRGLVISALQCLDLQLEDLKAAGLESFDMSSSLLCLTAYAGY